MFLFLSFVSFRDINTTEFDDLITNGNGTIPYFIMFYTGRCPECHAAVSGFCEAEDRVYDMAEFLTLNTNINREIAERYEIMGVPFFGCFFGGRAVPFFGRRNGPSFTNFIVETVGYRLQWVNDSWLDHEWDQVILFSKRKSPPSIMAAGYGMFAKYGIEFGVVKEEEMGKKVAEQEPEFPSVWFIKKGNTERKKFPSFSQVIEFQNEIGKFFGISIERRERHSDTNKCELPVRPDESEGTQQEDHDHGHEPEIGDVTSDL